MAVAERGRGSPPQVFVMLQHKWFKHSFPSHIDNTRSLFTASGTQGQSSHQPEKSFAEICCYGSQAGTVLHLRERLLEEDIEILKRKLNNLKSTAKVNMYDMRQPRCFFMLSPRSSGSF